MGLGGNVDIDTAGVPVLLRIPINDDKFLTNIQSCSIQNAG